MTIIPYKNKIQLSIEKPTVGGLDISSKETATEVGTILELPEDTLDNNRFLEIGDKIMFKAWAIDIVNYEGQNYYFIDADSEGICAIIKE